MDLLGIGPLEILAIALLMVLIFPARRIAETARQGGRFLRNLTRSETWKAVRSASDQIQHLPAALMREAELEELQELQRTLHKEVHDAVRLPAEPDKDDSPVPPSAAPPDRP